MQIEDHEFAVIASDGPTFKTVMADTLFIISGERYDIVVEANKPDVRDYFIRVSAMPPCMKEIEEFAVLRYHSGPVKDAKIFDFDDRKPPGWLDVYLDGRYFNTPKPLLTGIAISKAVSNIIDGSIINAKPDHSFNLFIATPQLDNKILFSGNEATKFMGEIEQLITNMSFNVITTPSDFCESKSEQRRVYQQHKFSHTALSVVVEAGRNR